MGFVRREAGCWVMDLRRSESALFSPVIPPRELHHRNKREGKEREGEKERKKAASQVNVVKKEREGEKIQEGNMK